MKTPRIHDFDPEAAARELSSPLEGMPLIEKPRAKPVVPPTEPLYKRDSQQQTQSYTPEMSDGQVKKKPVVKSTRRFVRRTFDYFEDQIEYLTRVSLEERLAGRNVTMASMLREALDRYIAEKNSTK
jgi:hypothetical protein